MASDDEGDLPVGEVHRRGAFDIGSGAIKLQIADVDAESGALLRVLFAHEEPVKFALDWKTHGELSAQIQHAGMVVLRDMCARCSRSGVTAYAAIATEVFRKAPNGPAYLAGLANELGLRVETVSQQEEARLGFLTAVALSARPRAEVIAWDSGGASFQITKADASGELLVYSGALGASVATALLVERVQGSSLAAKPTPNPCTLDEAEALVALLREALPEPPAWLRAAPIVTAIGGPLSLFNMAGQVLREEAGGPPAQGHPAAAADGAESAAAAAPAANPAGVRGAQPVRLRLEQVRGALLAKLGESDEVLRACGYREVELLLPKLCLLCAVMERCDLREVEYVPAIGSCAGLLVSGERFR